MVQKDQFSEIEEFARISMFSIVYVPTIHGSIFLNLKL